MGDSMIKPQPLSPVPPQQAKGSGKTAHPMPYGTPDTSKVQSPAAITPTSLLGGITGGGGKGK